MSIHNSYFSKNNTIISNSYSNTGRNPVTELIFGDTFNNIGYTRFIFDLDLTELQSKISDGTISTGCTGTITHTLRMTNTSSFDEGLLNTLTSQGSRRATSFDLVLFRIPNRQYWDEGVGYDYTDINDGVPEDRNYSDRASNWYQRTILSGWTSPGLYSNVNSGTTPYSGLTIVDTQHFEFGNENISFDMTSEINNIINGSLTGLTGWGIAYVPEVELLTGLSESYSVAFFTRHTQTFYEPFLETSYNDFINDDRNTFTQGNINKLYLYLYQDGNPINLDSNPRVNILDSNGSPVSGLQALTTCRRTEGVYEVTIPAFSGYSKPCTFQDVWTGVTLNGFSIGDITNEFVLYPYTKSISVGTTSLEPTLYGFDYFGIKQDEKIFNTDVRRVGVIVKKAYTTSVVLNNVEVSYRVYVKEGQTEVQVQDWTRVNRTPNEYYFYFDTRDKIPNEYFIDIKVLSSGQITTYKKQIKFQIVNYK